MSNSINAIKQPETLNHESEGTSFYWYLPALDVSSVTMDFLLKQGQTTIYSSSIFELPANREGLVEVQLPSTLNLEAEKVYTFEVSLYCNVQFDHYREIPFQLLNSERQAQLTQELEQATLEPSQENASSVAEAQANVYLRYNLWHQALAVLLQSEIEPSNPRQCSTPKCELLDYFGIEGDLPLMGVVTEEGFTLTEKVDETQPLNELNLPEGLEEPRDEFFQPPNSGIR